MYYGWMDVLMAEWVHVLMDLLWMYYGCTMGGWVEVKSHAKYGYYYESTTRVQAKETKSTTVLYGRMDGWMYYGWVGRNGI